MFAKGGKMARTSNQVQQYIGCLLSMARATLWDHSTYAEAQDQESLDKALEIVSNIMANEMTKNINRSKGASLHISDIE